MTRSQARRKPSAVYSSTLGMLSIPALFYPPLGLTNLVGVTKFLKYAGVRYRQDSPYYLWLFVKYDDSAEVYVAVPSLSFNVDVSLQQELKDLVPPSEWQDLQDKYGSGFIDLGAFAFQSAKTLYDLLKSFQNYPDSVQHLQTELYMVLW